MKQKETHRLREWIYGCQGEGWGDGIFREKGMVKDLGVDMYTLLYLKWVTKKDLLCSTGNFAQCYVAAWMETSVEKEWIQVYLWLIPFTIHLKPSHIVY